MTDIVKDIIGPPMVDIGHPIVKNITRYQVARWPELVHLADAWMSCAIYVYCEDDYWLRLLFLKEPLPGWAINMYAPDNKAGVSFLRESEWPCYIDLLRNEGPLKLYFYLDVTPPTPYFIFFSSREGIGEGEIASTLEDIRDLLARRSLPSKP